MGHVDLLALLLRSCSLTETSKSRVTVEGEQVADDDDDDGQSEPKKMRSPDDAADGLLWDEEIPVDVTVHDDEGSKLYVYVLLYRLMVNLIFI